MIVEIENQKEWDNFILSNNGEFLQSWKWGLFKEKLGDKILHLGIKKNKEKIAQALMIKHNLALGKSYLYCPRGPIFNLALSANQKIEAVKLLLKEIKQLAARGKIPFFRLEPCFGSENLNLEKIFADLKIKWKKINSIQPNETLIIDLSEKNENLLKMMHRKTRYNVHLAERHKVKIFNSENLEPFLQLLKETAKRQKIKNYGKSYYHNLFKEFQRRDNGRGMIKIYFARYKNKILAAHLILFWNKTAFYLYGGSTRQNRRVMADYLLHWEIIKEAREQSLLLYDFWGINEEKWPGLTRFKLGFGGKRLKYPRTYDLIFNKFWYSLYKMGNKFRKKFS